MTDKKLVQRVDALEALVSLITGVKFSEFFDGGNLIENDTVVGLRAGVNTKFNYTNTEPTTLVAYGEMYITPFNARPTAVTAAVWAKIEAGNPLLVPPTYSGYASGNLANFTQSNGRLTYAGTQPLYFSANLVGDAIYPGFITPSIPNYIQIVKNGNATNSDNSINVFEVFTTNSPVCAQKTVLLSQNDYLEVFIKNQTNTEKTTYGTLSLILSPLSVMGTQGSRYQSWSPVFTNNSGISGSITELQPSRFFQIDTGFICVLDLALTSNDSAISFNFTPPPGVTLTSTGKATLMGQVLNADTLNNMDGKIFDADSTSGNLVQISSTASVGSGDKTLKLTVLVDNS